MWIAVVASSGTISGPRWSPILIDSPSLLDLCPAVERIQEAGSGDFSVTGGRRIHPRPFGNRVAIPDSQGRVATVREKMGGERLWRSPSFFRPRR